MADRAGDFTVGDGSQRRTFWQAFSGAVPELSQRTGAECEKRMEALRNEQTAPPPLTGIQPLVLEDWERQEDGRYTGRVTGEASFLWVSVVREGRLISDPSSEPGWVEGVDGKIYELSRAGGASAASSTASAAMVPSAPSAPTMVLGAPQVAGLAASILLAGVSGFGFAGGFAPPPPPPAPVVYKTTKVIVSPGATVSKKLASKADAPAGLTAASGESGATAKPPTPREIAPLQLSEQRQRAEARLEKDKARAGMMQAKIKEDENNVQELKRLEAERGGDASAVNLKILDAPPAGIFPSN